ncbi:hypothetical protein BC567DRAFT_237542 [Phyllosticta citribraziliensis]
MASLHIHLNCLLLHHHFLRPQKALNPCHPLAAQTPYQPHATSSTSKTRLSPPSFASPASLVLRPRTSFLCPDSCPLGAWLRASAKLEPTQAFSKPFGCRPPASVKSMPSQGEGPSAATTTPFPLCLLAGTLKSHVEVQPTCGESQAVNLGFCPSSPAPHRQA